MNRSGVVEETPTGNRVWLAIVLVVSLAIGQIAFASPAQAATTEECINSVTKANGVWTLGSTQRWTAGSGSSNIVFTLENHLLCIRNLPGDADMDFGMRAYFCSGGGGYSTERQWLGANEGGPLYVNTPATSVLSGTCFQLSWRAKNADTANEAWKGRVRWQTS